MPQVLIRDVDAEVLERLKARAQRHGRSLQAELRDALRELSGVDKEAIQERLAKVRAMFAGRTFSDSVELIREDRER